ncbi:hypothetical protein H6F89_11075 [Cyanobacteria bacterium FACHB-63]|nr:hypothetical protein [Cyanobacteria bacterium FACHB-63]
MRLRSPDEINLERFNRMVGDWRGKPIDNMRRLFVKQVILDNETVLDVETIRVPGFIGISDHSIVENPQGKRVSGHADVVELLNRDQLLVCTYQWHKERYGIPIDLRRALESEVLIEAFIKNEGHHSSVIVPAQRFRQNQLIPSYATLNEPDAYHEGLYGNDGYVAIAQRLRFPNFVASEQARGYINTIICWIALLNPFVQFPDNYSGGDPTRIGNCTQLQELLKNGLLASLGDAKAIAFFNVPANKCYCSEFISVCLNTVLHPFNKAGLAELLEDAEKAQQILAIQNQQNKRQVNLLSQKTNNPEFKAFNIPMPVVPENLPPLNVLMTQQGQSVPNSLPFPPFSISQVIRRAFHKLLPRNQAKPDLNLKIAHAQARLLKSMKPALIQQLGLSNLPETDSKVVAVSQFLDAASDQLNEMPSNQIELEQKINTLMQKADELLIGADDRVWYVPPRIYVDLGQNDGDEFLPQGWGLRLETVGALIARSTIND